MTESGKRSIIRTAGVVANCRKPQAMHVLGRLAQAAAQTGLALFADEDTAPLLPSSTAMGLPDLFDRSDAILALGGDGTMLRVARELNGRDRPLLGINIGSLGFLTSVAQDDIERALACLHAGDYDIGIRSVAQCTIVRNGVEIARYGGLNDIVVSSGPSSRVITLDLAINRDSGTSYVCDGLIVSTPTGSTGHSLSAGGPIMTPDTPAFVISLICPHTLSSRPLVVPDNSEIVITAAQSKGTLRLSVDGQIDRPIERGDSVVVVRRPTDVRFIHLPGHSYFSVLRQKLHWSGSNV